MQMNVCPHLEKHMFSCKDQHFVGVCECVCVRVWVCVILPLKTINTGVAPGLLPIQHGCRQCLRSGHIRLSIHPSLHPSVIQFLPASRKETMAFQAGNNLINQTRVESDLLHNPLALILLSICQLRSYTIAFSLFLHCGSSSHAAKYEHKHRKDTYTNINPQKHMQRQTDPGICAQHTLTCSHTHTRVHQASWQPNQASGAGSLMFVKVINFLGEIRGRSGRTEGDGCQPQNLSAFIYWHWGSLSPQHRAFTWAPGLPTLTQGPTKKGFE